MERNSNPPPRNSEERERKKTRRRRRRKTASGPPKSGCSTSQDKGDPLAFFLVLKFAVFFGMLRGTSLMDQILVH